MTRKTTSIAFSGSGGNLFKQFGSWKALEPICKIDAGVATSGGAFPLVTMALDFSFVKTLQMLRNFKTKELIDPYLVPALSIFQQDKLAFIKGQKIYEKFKEIFPVKFKETSFPIAICCTDYKTKQLKLFGTKETPNEYIYEALRGTMSLPVIFTPHKYKDTYLLDGGLSENFYLKYFSPDKNLIGVRMVDKPCIENKLESVQKLITDCLFIPIIKNEEKNIEDAPHAKIINLVATNTSYDFTNLTYQYMLDLISEGEIETIQQLNKLW